MDFLVIFVWPCSCQYKSTCHLQSHLYFPKMFFRSHYRLCSTTVKFKQFQFSMSSIIWSSTTHSQSKHQFRLILSSCVHHLYSITSNATAATVRSYVHLLNQWLAGIPLPINYSQISNFISSPTLSRQQGVNSSSPTAILTTIPSVLTPGNFLACTVSIFVVQHSQPVIFTFYLTCNNWHKIRHWNPQLSYSCVSTSSRHLRHR